MSETTIDADSIGLELSLEDFRLPDDIAAELGTLYGSDPPATGAEWMETMRSVKQDMDGEPPTVADLCTTDDGLHTFENDHRRGEYVCVLDPLAVPFLVDEPGTVRSTTPEREATVEVELARDGVGYSHPEAVVSLGISDHVDAGDDPTLERVYTQVCGYIHVFADESEYRTWAGGVDAVTTSVPVDTGVGIAGEIARTLFEPAG